MAVTVSICVISTVIIKGNFKTKEYLNRADDIFQSNFSLLCNNLNEQESEEANEENEKHAYICFSILNLTSFSENEAMNKLVHRLYDLSEEKELYTELTKTQIEKLNRLSHNLQDEKLLKNIVEEIN